jgi:hypothetical protein
MPTTGLEMNSKNRLHLLPEATAGTLDTGATPRLMTSLRVEKSNNENRDTHRPQGYNVDAWHALVQKSAGLSGSIKPDYLQFDTLMELLCGVADDSADSGGLTTNTYLVPESGARNLQTFSGEWGTPESAERLLYIILQSLSLRITRGNSPAIEGNISLLSLKPSTSGNAMTGGPFENPIQLPVLPQHVTVRRHDALASVSAATAMATVHEITISHEGLADGHMFFDEGDITADSHVDGAEPQHSLSLALAYSTSGDCAALKTNADASPATPQWFEVRFKHPNNINLIKVQFYASVKDAIEQSAAGNVYQMIFPLSLVLNGELATEAGAPAIMRVLVTTATPD